MFCLALSFHLLAGDWNGIHPCIRFERDGWAAGAFLNSENNVSFMAGKVWRDGEWWAEAGLATGYSAAKVVPFGRAGYGPFFIAPAHNGRDFGAVVGFEVRFE